MRAACTPSAVNNPYLEHPDSLGEHRLVVLASTCECFDAPERTKTERALFAADTVIRLGGIVPIHQSLPEQH